MNPPFGSIVSDAQLPGVAAGVVTTFSGKPALSLSTERGPGGGMLMYPAACAVYVMGLMVRVLISVVAPRVTGAQ